MEQQEKTEQALSAKESKAMKKEEKRKLKETKREQKAGKIGKKRKKAPIIIAAIIIILIVIRMVSCAFSGSAGVMVSTTNAFRGDIEENVSTSGKVVSEEKAVLFAPVGGRLNEVNVAAGDAVKAGDVLMTYDMDQMEERLQEATLQQTKSSASYNSTMTENSKSQAKLNEANTNLAVLDKQLSLGGVDLQLLGIGHNGHIGFNEPGESFDKQVHCVNLTESTIEANKRFFASAEDVPKQAYTMGIKTIMQAKKILIVASGEDKAEIVQKAFFGPITPQVPASVLQLHNDVTLVADEAALSKLSE